MRFEGFLEIFIEIVCNLFLLWLDRTIIILKHQREDARITFVEEIL